MKYVNFSQLRSFHAVAQAESITLASKQINISQPTITKQIQLLEEYYSIIVINRHARGVTLTELGKKLFIITSNLFELEERAIDLFSSDLNINKGTIITGTSGTYFIIKLIKEFKKLHPSIQLIGIKKNQVDIGIFENKIKILFEGDGKLIIKKSTYHPEFGVTVPSNKLVYHLIGKLPVKITTRINW